MDEKGNECGRTCTAIYINVHRGETGGSPGGQMLVDSAEPFFSSVWRTW